MSIVASMSSVFSMEQNENIMESRFNDKYIKPQQADKELSTPLEQNQVSFSQNKLTDFCQSFEIQATKLSTTGIVKTN